MARESAKIYHDPLVAPSVEDLRKKKFNAWRNAGEAHRGFCEWEDCIGVQSVKTLNVVGIRLDLCRTHFEQMV